MKNMFWLFLLSSLSLRAVFFPPDIVHNLGGTHDIFDHERIDILRTPFDPLAGEGIKQLIRRLGTTYNEIESKIGLIQNIFADYLEIEQLQAHCPTILYATDFGTTGTIIDTPGYYMLCDDIIWNAQDGSSGITTATSHVTIDLNYHTIMQTGTGIETNGITIAPDVHNVTIKQGTLSDFEQYGINITSTEGDGCYNIKLDHITIENSGSDGMHFEGAIGSEIYDCLIRHCLATKSSGAGLWASMCHDSYLTNCSFNNNGNYGAEVTECKKLSFTDCHFNNNAARGASLENSQSCILRECTFNNNSSDSIAVSGLYAQGTGFIVKNCSASGNSSTNSQYCTGLELYGSGICQNCISSHNFAENYDCWGIYAEFPILTNCSAIDNRATGIGNCYGLDLVSTSPQYCSCCQALANKTDITGNGVGIEVLSPSTLKNCSAFLNSDNGIKNENEASNIIGCVAGNNRPNFAGSYPAQFAQRSTLGNHWNIGEQENISLLSVGRNEVGCVTYLDSTITRTGTIGFIITQPGYYILCDDFVFNDSSITAFTIRSNYVTIDLNGKSISGTLDTIISITSGLANIVIKNGNFSGFDTNGIFVDNNCHHIDIEDIHMSSTSCISAFTFNGTFGNEVHDCSIKNCSVTELIAKTSPAYLINLINCSDMILKGSNFNGNGNFTNFIALNGSRKCRMINCTWNNNYNNQDVCEVAFLSNNADSFLFDTCTINNNSSSNEECDCLTIDQAHGGIIRNCTIRNNSGSLCTGIHIINGTGNSLKSCAICTNSSTTSTMSGIEIEDDGNIVEHCCVHANKSNEDCYGILISGANNSIFGCTTTYNHGITGYGIEIADSADKTVIEHCTSFDNTTAGISNNGTNSIIVGSNAGNNSTDFEGTPGAYAVSYCKTGSTLPQPYYKYDNAEFTL